MDIKIRFPEDVKSSNIGNEAGGNNNIVIPGGALPIIGFTSVQKGGATPSVGTGPQINPSLLKKLP
jgi:hypothetical protein